MQDLTREERVTSGIMPMKTGSRAYMTARRPEDNGVVALSHRCHAGVGALLHVSHRAALSENLGNLLLPAPRVQN